MRLTTLSMSALLLILCPACLILWPESLSAQTGRPDMTFGNISPETFAPEVYPLDSTANAVYLFDKGRVYFDQSMGNGFGFGIVYERHSRIRILHKNAFGLATVVLARSRQKGQEVLIRDLKGATYNLEDGKVIVAKADKSNVFQEASGEMQLQKMALPSVKEGSVIEFSYSIVYPGIGFMPSWEFQRDYPTLWSEYDITIPALAEYLMKRQGYLPYTIDSTIHTSQFLQVNIPSGLYGRAFNDTWHGDALERIWAIRDVPPLAKREPYITSLRNYSSKVEFQLSALHLPGVERSFLNSWDKLVEELMKSDKFGEELTERNHWMSDECKQLAGSDKTSLAAARNIFNYVRDHFEGTGVDGIYLSQPLKKTWEDKKGNIADINLLLTALYQHQGFTASPVLLSTRGHGMAFVDYPLLNDYNYVVTRVTAEGQTYLLDASRNSAGFGQLPDICYNGPARTIDTDHQLIPLSPDSLTERRYTAVLLNNDDSLGYSGSIYHRAGVFESMELRSRMKRFKSGEFFENLRKSMASFKTMLETGIDSLDNPDVPLSWHYNMKYNLSSATIYFNPIMHERTNTNPFNAPVRHYPVELPYRMDYFYVLNMQIPNGFTVVDMPKSERAVLEDGLGMFEYLVDKDSTAIKVQYRLKIDKTFFDLDDYQALRNFYAFIIRKEKEQIVFKKTKL